MAIASESCSKKCGVCAHIWVSGLCLCGNVTGDCDIVCA